MIPEHTYMIKVALELEEAGHRHGWGVSATLGTIYHDSPHLICEPFPIQPGDEFPGIGLEQALLNLADRITLNTILLGPELAQDAAMRSAANATCGIWLVAEGRLSETIEATDNPRFRVLSKNQRIRTCIVLDCGGRLYQTIRGEGEKPTVEMYMPGDTRRQATGGVVDAMRRMLLAIGADMTPGQIDLPKVSSVGT